MTPVAVLLLPPAPSSCVRHGAAQLLSLLFIGPAEAGLLAARKFCAKLQALMIVFSCPTSHVRKQLSPWAINCQLKRDSS